MSRSAGVTYDSNRQEVTCHSPPTPPTQGFRGLWREVWGGGFYETSNKPFVSERRWIYSKSDARCRREWRGTITPPRKEAASENQGHLGNTTRTDWRRSQNEEQMNSRMFLSFPSNFLKLVIFTLNTFHPGLCDSFFFLPTKSGRHVALILPPIFGGCKVKSQWNVN